MSFTIMIFPNDTQLLFEKWNLKFDEIFAKNSILATPNAGDTVFKGGGDFSYVCHFEGYSLHI